MRAVLLGLALVGCAGDGAEDRPGPCDEESRHEAIAPGTIASSDNDDLVVELVEADETPAVVGENSWLIEIRDGGGVAIEGCIPSFTPWMPDHNHGATEQSVVTEEGGGQYRVQFEPIMGGYWELTVGVDCVDAPVGEAVFKVCVET